MKTLLNLFRRWLLVRILRSEQLRFLDAIEAKDCLRQDPVMRRALLARLLRDDQLHLVNALEAPDRWMPDPGITEKEREGWGIALQTPLMIKIDTAMINLIQQEAQRAHQYPTAELAKAVGFAAGYRASWEMAKTLSRLRVADDTHHEETASTAAGDLGHLAP